jgi:hypothetical protein
MLLQRRARRAIAPQGLSHLRHATFQKRGIKAGLSSGDALKERGGHRAENRLRATGKIIIRSGDLADDTQVSCE